MKEQKTIKSFFQPFIPVLILMFLIGLIASVIIEVIYVRQTAQDIQTELVLEGNDLRNDINNQRSDLLYLADVVRKIHEYMPDNNELFIKTTQNIFTDFSQEKGIYDQVRLFSPSGMELVRINLVNNQPVVVPNNELQDKSDRYFYQDSRALKTNEIYISKFDLNMEKGKIEQPIKPVYRLITPVDLPDGIRLGYVVLNILGNPFLGRIRTTQPLFEGNLYFVNNNGDWLIGPSGTTAWGFMYDNPQNSNIASKFPELWRNYHGEDLFQNFNLGGLFTLKVLNPFENFSSRSINNRNTGGILYEKWILISHLDLPVLISNISLVVFIITIIMIVILFFTFQQIARNRYSESLAFQARKEAEEKLGIISKASQDAIIMINQGGIIQFWSQSAERMFGYPVSEAVGKEIHGVIAMHQSDREQAYKGMEKYAVTGSGPIIHTLREVDGKTKDGKLIPVEISINPIRIEGEWWAVGIVRDISDRRQAEKEIREMAQFPLEISNAIMRVDKKYKLLYANPASKFLLENLGVKVGEKAAGPVRDLVKQALHDDRRMESSLEVAERIYRITAFPIVASGYVNLYGSDVTEEDNTRRDLIANEYKYRNLLNTVPQYVFHKDINGRYITINNALARRWGVRADQVQGKTDFDLFSPEVAQHKRDYDKRVIEAKVPIEAEEPFDPSKAPTEIAHMVKAPILNQKGEIEGVLGIFWDVTEQVRAEEKLALMNQNLENLVKERTQEIERINDRLSINEKRFRAIVENQVEYVFRWNLQGVITYANQSFSNKYGKAITEIEGAIYRDVVACEGMDQLYSLTKDITKKKPLLTTEIRSVMPDGKVVWEQWNSRAILNDRNEIVEIQNVGRDITELKHVQEQLQIQSSALEAAANGIVITEPNGKIIWANQALSRITGFSPAEITSKSPNVFKSGKMDEDFYHKMWETINAGKVWSGEVINKKKDGSLYYEEMTITPVSTVGGAITNFIAIKQDITTRKEMEDETRKAREQAEMANRAKSTFLANMSHEIRTPLNAIMGLNYLLKRTGVNNIQQQYLDKMQSASKNLLDTINDVLDFSKIEADKIEIENITFNLDDVILDITDTEALKAHQKGIELIISIGEGIPDRMEGDPIRLKQVLRNLTNNAVKFTEHGEVAVEIDKVKEDEKSITLKFSVSDTGIGLTPEQINNLFQPFQQADLSTTRKYGGTGLGLAISKRIVQLMNGEISVASEYGHGSVFTIVLPFTKVPPRKNQELFLFEELIGKKVLIVDSNLKSAQWLSRILKQTQADITQVGDLDTLKEILDQSKNERPFDVILVNNNVKGFRRMSDMAGIKQQFPTGSVKLIHLTDTVQFAQQTADLKEKSIDAILIKPISASQLYDTWLTIFGAKHKHTVVSRTKTNSMKQEKPIQEVNILLVEDNDINQDVISDLLRQNGAMVDTACNGQEAIDILHKQSFDLVLMDVQMPVMDGFKATREIRSEAQFESLPIIALTANAQVEEKKQAEQAGMNDYITKPIEPKLLFEVINKWTHKDQNGERIANRKEKENTIPGLTIQGIDVPSALSRMRNDEDKLLGLLNKFIKNHESDFDDMRTQLGQHDWMNLRMKAHSMKGAAANLGATDLAEMLNLIESTAIKEKADGIDGKLNKAYKMFNSIRSDVERINDLKEKTTSPVSIVSLKPEELKIKIELLQAKVEEHDPEAKILIKEINESIPADSFDGGLIKAQYLLEKYDFNSAIIEIKKAVKLIKKRK